MNIFKKSRQFNSNKGSGLVQTLLAIIFISLAALVMSGTLKEFTNYLSNKDRAIDTAMSFESLIIHASQDLDLLRPYASDLMNGIVPTNFSIQHTVDGAPVDIAKIGETLTFDENGRSCASNPTLCRIESKLDIKCYTSTPTALPSPAPVSTPPPYADCRLAYRIKVLTRVGKEIQIQSFGSSSENLASDDKNYDLLLAYDVFSQDKVSAASAKGIHIITGYNKFNGDITVASLPMNSCDNGYIPKGMTFSGGAFQMNCLKSKIAHCPTNYSLYNLSMSSADPQSIETKPTCVFVTKKTVPWNVTLPPAPAISKKLCPQFYVTSADCTPQSSAVTYVKGTCSESYSCPAKDAQGNLLKDSKGNQINTTCSRSWEGAQPSAPTIVKADGTQSASCTTAHGAGECGGYSYFTNPNVEMTGNCVLNEPEFIDGTWQ